MGISVVFSFPVQSGGSLIIFQLFRHKNLVQVIFLYNRTYQLFQDKLSFSAENFIRSENNLALLQLYVLL